MNPTDSFAPSGKVDESPSAFAGIDDAAAMIIAAFITTYGVSVGSAMGSAFKNNQHVFVRIEASWKDETGHSAVFTLTNLTEHGLYIENILVSGPQNPAASVRFYQGIRKNAFDLGAETNHSDDIFPLLLSPLSKDDRQPARFVIQLPDDDKTRKPGGSTPGSLELVISYSRLNNSQQETKKTLIRLRHSGPVYRG